MEKTVDLISALERLLKLLKDPHPGLFTWHMACEQVAKEVEQGIRESRQ